VRFVRRGGGAANAARTKVAKGRLAAHLLAAPATPVPGPDAIGADVLGPGWEVEAAPGQLVATWLGP
jgi:hypothetical protein